MKLTGRLIANVVAFFVASTLIVVYGVVEFFGNPLDDPVQVSTELETSAGLRENFSVSHNGIVVGVVSGTELTDDGVEIRMTLNDGVEVPAAVEARVVRASPVGEQRLELEPTGDGSGPLLADGDVVPAADDAEPPVVSEVVDELVDLIEDVPPGALNTLLEEGSLALEGRSDDIRLFIESSTVLNEAFLSNEDDFRRLLDSAPDALGTLNAVGDELETSLANTAELSRVLADRSDELVDLFRQGNNLAVIGDRILDESGANLICLTSDLADLNEFLNESGTTANIDRAFQLNFGFFGPINNLAPAGPAKDLGLGTPRPDQNYLRVQLITPPQQPAASPNVPARAINDVRPGAACLTPVGPGAAAPTQSDPAPLFGSSEVIPPTDDDARLSGLAGAPVMGDLVADAPGSTTGGVLLPSVAALLLVLTALRRVIVRRLAALWFG